MQISNFRGIRLDQPAASLDSNEFQIDHGSDRFSMARWRRRRGMRRSDVPKLAAAVATALGFEIPGGYAAIFAAGANATGNAGVAEGPSTVATIATHSTLTPNHRAHGTTLKRNGYLVNGWDKALRWDGRKTTFVTAGIAGPSTEIDSWTPDPIESAGSGTAGLHLVRYRYLDSVTGYVSEPSEEREVTITTANGKLSFPIGDAPATIGPDAGTGYTFTATTIVRTDGGSFVTDGALVGDYVTVANAADPLNDGTWGPITGVTASTLTIASGGLTADTLDTTATFDIEAAYRIQPSSDSKVDKIVIELSPVNDSTFYNALEVPNTDNTSAEVDISDPELEVSFLEWPETGHYPPPVAKNVVGFRERLWLFGQVIHNTGNCDVTNGSPDVPEGAINPDWRASALGDETATPATYPDVAWFFQRDGDSQAYEIDYYDASANKIVLKSNYAGVTGTDVDYQIFSRANVVWISEAGYPEGFSPGGYLDGFESDLTAAVGAGSAMVFYSLTGMDIVSWDLGPLTDPVRRSLSRQRGALNQRVVVEVDQTVYSMDRKGWHAWNGTVPQDIGRPIEAIRDEIDYSYADYFSCVYLPELRAIRWFVTYTGDTYPKNYVQFDIGSGSWSTGSYFQGIAESKLIPTSEGLQVAYGDDQGYVWLADKGLADGVDEAESRAAIAPPVLGGSKLANPASLPSSTASAFDLSPSDDYAAAGTSAAPYLFPYSLSGATLTLLASTAPPGAVHSLKFNHDGTKLAVGHNSSPYLSVYSLSGATVSLLTSPTPSTAFALTGVAWNNDGSLIVGAARLGTPTLVAFSVSGSTVTRLTNPSIPAGVTSAQSVCFSPDGAYLYVAWEESPYLSIYSVSGSTFTLLSGVIDTLPAADSGSLSASPDGNFVAVMENVNPNKVHIYSSAVAGTLSLSDTYTFTPGHFLPNRDGIAWGPTSDYLILSRETGGTPFWDLLTLVNGAWTLYDGSPALAGAASAASQRTANYFGFGHASSPYLSVFQPATIGGTTLTLVGVTLPTAGEGVDGCYAYHPASGEVRRITSNTATTITIASTFTSLASGDLIWIGAIPSKLKTKAFRDRRLGRKRAPRNLWVEFVPLTSARYLQLRTYDSLSGTAKAWATGTRNDPDGTQFPGADDQYPATDWLIDMSESDGNVRINLGNEFRRYFEIELEIYEPDADVQILSLETEGWDLEDEQ